MYTYLQQKIILFLRDEKFAWPVLHKNVIQRWLRTPCQMQIQGSPDVGMLVKASKLYA